MERFYTILTNVGRAKIANAHANRQALELSVMAVGDGGGSYYNPSEDLMALKNEVYRRELNNLVQDPDNAAYLICEMVIPSTAGGFYVREAGIFDAEGDMIAVGKIPETYKPALEAGAAKDLYVRFVMEVSNAEAVTLKIDPSVVLATKEMAETAAANAVTVHVGEVNPHNQYVMKSAHSADIAGVNAAIADHGHALTDSKVTGVLPIGKGGTGAADIAGAVHNLFPDNSAAAHEYLPTFDTSWTSPSYLSIEGLAGKLSPYIASGGFTRVERSQYTASGVITMPVGAKYMQFMLAAGGGGGGGYLAVAGGSAGGIFLSGLIPAQGGALTAGAGGVVGTSGGYSEFLGVRVGGGELNIELTLGSNGGKLLANANQISCISPIGQDGKGYIGILINFTAQTSSLKKGNGGQGGLGSGGGGSFLDVVGLCGGSGLAGGGGNCSGKGGDSILGFSGAAGEGNSMGSPGGGGAGILGSASGSNGGLGGGGGGYSDPAASIGGAGGAGALVVWWYI